MTLETQPKSGAARYRVNPRNRREVQVQPQPGARWEPYLLAASDEEATQAVLKLAWEPREKAWVTVAVQEAWRVR